MPQNMDAIVIKFSEIMVDFMIGSRCVFADKISLYSYLRDYKSRRT